LEIRFLSYLHYRSYIEELCKKISENEGKQHSKIWELVPNKGYKIVFCEDPFGNVIEIYTHGYE
jgi:hypothetical protein